MGKFTNVIARRIVAETRIYSQHVYTSDGPPIFALNASGKAVLKSLFGVLDNMVLSSAHFSLGNSKARSITGMWALDEYSKQPCFCLYKHLHQG